MAGNGEQYPSDHEVAQIIGTKAKILARKLRTDDQQRQDFEQKLWVHYLEIRDLHDPERGQWSTFLDRVFENKGLNMIAEWEAGKRVRERRALRWDDELHPGDDDSLTLEDVYSQQDYHEQTGWGSPPDELQIDRRLLVERVLKRLPRHLQQLARRLKDQSFTEVARELKIPRSTLYSRAERIAEALREAGLADDDELPPIAKN